MAKKLPLESDKVEYKQVLPKGDKLARELIAFANSKGGRLIIGVADDGETILGVVPNQAVEEKVANIVSDCCTPRVPYSISYETLCEKTVLVVNVKAGNDTPYSLIGKEITEGVYVRIGSTTRKANREELARLLRKGRGISFDSETSEVDLNNIGTDLVERLVKERANRLSAPIVPLTKELYEDLGLSKENNLTVAGVLLCTKNPQSSNEFSRAVIQSGRFKGTKKGILIDQAEFDGPLAQQIDSAVHFALKNSRTSSKIVGKKREERLEYPEEVLREIITNAVVHRDYSIAGSAIMLAIYDDRIEISSPGGLPAHVTVENIANRQYSRNPIIAKRLFEMGYFDSWGQGIDMILDWSKSEGIRSPVFKDSYGEYSLTIYSPLMNTTETQDSSSEFNLRKNKIIEFIKTNGRITNRECRELLSISKTQAQVLLNKLLQKELISRRGRGRSVEYTLPSQ